MANYKLLMDDDLNEDFSLLAIHCSEESFKMAYLLNKYAGLRLKRRRVDLDFSANGLDVTFPCFEFEDLLQYTNYTLVGNKCKSVTAHTHSSGGLFGADASESTVITYLLPEYKNVDFFLKIDSDFASVPLRKLSASINEIKQVISAYTLEASDIKSKNNLIFD
ncbi:MAG: IPExxxVDY family protein [Flavobacteriales bacterium]|jgi:hypothetical protein|uniref:IPExxxVDY family protein n=1 Tax=Candidatus Ulvibacter alkanivorans TaxID=2267620 RepID=UPI000DF37E0F|nr:IPExxxVDY family protein [Candidatus Ulvibacter alkanivorans]MCH2489804.1 IPExxxVDY family protein [Flavobacteriales bacterium]